MGGEYGLNQTVLVKVPHFALTFRQAYECHANSYLVKPVNFGEFTELPISAALPDRRTQYPAEKGRFRPSRRFLDRFYRLEKGAIQRRLPCGILTHSTAWSILVWQIATRPIAFLGEFKMSTAAKNDARLNVRLPSELKQTIEQAAAVLGQSITDFTISAVVREARHVIQDAQVTRLSNRDRDAFLDALESADAKPNSALKAAARRYKKQSAKNG